MKTKIHRRSIEAASTITLSGRCGPKSAVFLWDTELTGFGLKVTPQGKKTFLVQKRPHKGAKVVKRYTIGAYPSVSPEEARTQAKALLGRITLGLPSSPVLGHPQVSFKVEIEKYYAEHIKTKLKPTTQRDMRYMIDKYLLPFFGNAPLGGVSHLVVRSFHTALGSKHPYRANRVLALLSKFFSWVGPRTPGHPANTINPCKGIEKFREKKRDRLMSPEEFRTLLSCKLPPVLRLLVLTGLRKSEALGLRWEYLDLQKQLIQLPDSKTGGRIVYLDHSAVELLQGLGVQSQGWVFPGQRGSKGHLIGLQKIWKKLLRDAGLSDDIRIHDLRHHYASLAARELPLPLVMSLLGHREVRTTMGYVHSNQADLHLGVQLLGEKISKLS
jgi:integrase